MLRFLLLAALALLGSSPALAQNTTALVVGTCGTVSIPFKAGNAGPLTVDTTGKLCSSASGGGGTPGGSNGQIQYNNAGAFGGTATGTGVLTAIGNAVDGSGGLLTYASIGTSGAKVPLLNAANTWGAAQTLGSNALIFNGTNVVASAANTVDLYNSTNVQTVNLYATRTDASNYERLAFSFASNHFKITTEAAGTGGNRYLTLKADANIIINGGSAGGRSISLLSAGTGIWYFASTGHLIPETTATYDIGASGGNQVRNIYSGKIVTSSTTLHETSVALANGAAAAFGTLANAPASGNPTKWIPINDNGTTRYVPAW